ncbi:MAG TPA: hypothetical protein VMT93_02035 [Gemmatimonadaceae bacterium]|nr:hypothetical protein [Gemmatimonadaceae bacterium]
MTRTRLLAAFFPSFPLQVAVRSTPGLKAGPDAGAFAVADVDVAIAGRRGEVPPNVDLLAVSAAARRAGVRAGMTVTQARVACPGIVVRAKDGAAHEAARIAAAEVLSGFGPRVEVTADGAAAWVDLTGESPSREHAITREALLALRRAGFVARAAVASQKFTARAVAEHARAARNTVITAGGAREALAALPVAALAADLATPEARRTGAHALHAFARLGVRTLEEVARLPADTLARRFGAHAARFSALARGEDPTPLVPFRIPEALFERVEMPAPAETVEPMLFALKMLADRVGARLAGRSRAAAKLAVHLVLEHEAAQMLDLRLPRPTTVTKTILEIARERFSALTLPDAVSEMALEVVDSVPTRRTQLALFDGLDRPIDPKRAPPSPERLAVTLGRLATAFGDGAVFAARLADEHRPEAAYVPAPLDGETAGIAAEAEAFPRGKRATSAGTPAPAPTPDPALRPTRVLREPEPVSFYPPAHGRDAELVVRGARLRVGSIVGPERQSGAWWDAPYDRDYYFVRTDDGSAWWIFHDRAVDTWRLHGLFD